MSLCYKFPTPLGPVLYVSLSFEKEQHGSMDNSVVQLQIPNRWMLWRIYHAKEDEKKAKDDALDLQVEQVSEGWALSEYVRRGDPMDEDGFDDATSFPSVKPDRDLFGPPNHCRKQRGWYYVKRWPPTTHSVAMPPRYATGADIPQELFRNIQRNAMRHTLSIKEGKREFGTLRLVCRHWEELCFSLMFQDVYMQNHRDVEGLLTLLDQRAARGWPPYRTQRIHLFMLMNPALQVSESGRPWIGMALSNLSPRFNTIVDFSLTIRGPMPAGRKLTSAHLSSPCRSPWHPPFIRHLNLLDLYFQKLDYLVQVLRELPYLERVYGQKITWDASLEVYPRATTFIPSTRDIRTVVEYKLADCQPGLAGILACALSLSGAGPISQTDVDILYRLPSAMTTSEKQMDTVTSTEHRQEAHRYESVVFICNHDYSSPYTSVEYLPIVCAGLSTPTAARVRTVQFIAFDFCDTAPQGPGDLRANATYWDGVVDEIKKLTTHPYIFLTFKSPESAILFRKLIGIPKMSDLHFPGRIKYALEESSSVYGRLRLIEFGDDDDWRVLVMAPFLHAGQVASSSPREVKNLHTSDNPDSWAHALRRLVTWLTSH